MRKVTFVTLEMSEQLNERFSRCVKDEMKGLKTEHCFPRLKIIWKMIYTWERHRLTMNSAEIVLTSYELSRLIRKMTGLLFHQWALRENFSQHRHASQTLGDCHFKHWPEWNPRKFHRASLTLLHRTGSWPMADIILAKVELMNISRSYSAKSGIYFLVKSAFMNHAVHKYRSLEWTIWLPY